MFIGSVCIGFLTQKELLESRLPWDVYEVQNNKYCSITLLIFKMWKIYNVRFMGNLLLSISVVCHNSPSVKQLWELQKMNKFNKQTFLNAKQ